MIFGKKEIMLVEGLVKDPICGMAVDPTYAYYTEVGGKIYYFCGASCKATFKKATKKTLNMRPVKVRESHRKGEGSCH